MGQLAIDLWQSELQHNAVTAHMCLCQWYKADDNVNCDGQFYYMAPV